MSGSDLPAASIDDSMGSLRVTLQELTISREDKLEEDDFKTWAQVYFVGSGGLPSARYMALAGEDAKLSRTSVTNGNVAAYNFARNTHTFPVDDASLSELVSTACQILVFSGGARDATVDALVGVVSIPLDALVSATTDRVKGVFPLCAPALATYLPPGVFPSAHAYTGSIVVEVRPNATLEGALLGGRVLSIPDLTMQSIPPAWYAPIIAAAEAAASPHAQASSSSGAHGAAAPKKASASAAASAASAHPVPLDAAALAHAADAAALPDAATGFRYILGLSLPGGDADAAAFEFCAGAGRVAFDYPGRPAPVTAGERAVRAAAARAAAAVAPPPASSKGASSAAGASAGSKPGTPHTATHSKPGTPAAAAHASGVDDGAVKGPAASEGSWVVQWSGVARAFLSAARVEGLRTLLARGGVIEGTVRRVAVSHLPIAADAVNAGAPALPGGGNSLEACLAAASAASDAGGSRGVWCVTVGVSDAAARGAVQLVVDPLSLAGVTNATADAAVTPVSSSEGEIALDAANAAARVAALDALAAAASIAAANAAGGGKPGSSAGKAGAKPGSAAGAAPAHGATAVKTSTAHAPPKKLSKAEEAAAAAKKAEEEAAAAAAAAAPHPYVVAGTRVHATIILSAPLAPAPVPPQDTAEDLVAVRAPPPLVRAPPDAAAALRRELAAAAREIAAAYEAAGGGGDSAALDSLNSTGAIDGMRSALRTAAARIVREKFAGLPGATDAAGPDGGRDAFVASLISYMMGHLHAALNAVADEAAEPSPPPPPPAPPRAPETETPGRRLARIAHESEFVGNGERAARVHATRIALAESAAAAGGAGGSWDVGGWLDFGIFCARRGPAFWARAATALREAVGVDARSPVPLLALAAVQLARGEATEAMVFAADAARELEVRAARDAPRVAAAAARGTPVASEAANTRPLAHAVGSLAAAAAGDGTRAAAELLAATRALAACFTALGARADDVARASTPAAVYAIAGRFCLTVGLDALARASLELSRGAMADTDAPRVQRADLAVLRAARYASAIGAMRSRPRTEHVDAESAARAAGGLANVASATATASAAHGGSPSDAVDAAANEAVAAASAAAARVARGIVGDESVVVARGGAAYDGAIVTCAEASRVASDALALSELAWGAHDVLGTLWAAGLRGPRARVSAAGSDLPLLRGGAPEPGDVDIADLTEAARAWVLATSSFSPPLHAGYARLLADDASALRDLPPHAPTPSAAAPFAPLPPGTAARADAIFASASGVGGALLLDDGGALPKLYLRLANVQLQLAAVEAPESAAVVLAAARDSFARAISAARADSSSEPPGARAGPWSLAWLGLGRALWAQGESAEAEAAFGEANALDNGNSVTWAWLAHLCLCSADSGGLDRTREAAAALNESLKAGLTGDCTETVVLLQTLAERYTSMGEPAIAGGLLRRAVLHCSSPLSASHLDALLRARSALAELVVSGGAPLEESVRHLLAVVAGPGGLAGELVSAPLAESIRSTRVAASNAAARGLRKLGRDDEAAAVEGRFRK